MSPLISPLAAALGHNLQLATVSDHDLGGGLSGVGSDSFDPLDDVHAFDDAAKDYVLSV